MSRRKDDPYIDAEYEEVSQRSSVPTIARSSRALNTQPTRPHFGGFLATRLRKIVAREAEELFQAETGALKAHSERMIAEAENARLKSHLSPENIERAIQQEQRLLENEWAREEDQIKESRFHRRGRLADAERYSLIAEQRLREVKDPPVAETAARSATETENDPLACARAKVRGLTKLIERDEAKLEARTQQYDRADPEQDRRLEAQITKLHEQRDALLVQFPELANELYG